MTTRSIVKTNLNECIVTALRFVLDLGDTHDTASAYDWMRVSVTSAVTGQQ